jgi:hypothetical protein
LARIGRHDIADRHGRVVQPAATDILGGHRGVAKDDRELAVVDRRVDLRGERVNSWNWTGEIGLDASAIADRRRAGSSHSVSAIVVPLERMISTSGPSAKVSELIAVSTLPGRSCRPSAHLDQRDRRHGADAEEFHHWLRSLVSKRTFSLNLSRR